MTVKFEFQMTVNNASILDEHFSSINSIITKNTTQDKFIQHFSFFSITI